MARVAKLDDLTQPVLITEGRSPKETFRYLRNYLAGQFVGATRDDALLDEVLKCLFCKLYIETSTAEELPTEEDAFALARYTRSVFSKVRRDFPDIYPEETEILLDPQAISTVMRECQFSLLDAESDPIGNAFEVFVGSESRGRTGQFFTPRTVTDFLVQTVDPRPGKLLLTPPAARADSWLLSPVISVL